MPSLIASLRRFLVSDDGPTTVEYAVMVALVLLFCVTAIHAISSSARTSLAAIKTRVGG